MTLKEIEARVNEIKAHMYDDEAAHSMEDGLRCDFIEYVAESYTGALAKKAKLVLSTEDLDFSRWCA